MFKNLRNRLIITNVGITTVVLVIVFTSIYFISAHSALDRPMPQDAPGANPEMSQMMDQHIHAERQASLDDLLATLIFTGIIMDFVVAVISYFLAEKAIEPVKKAYETQKIFIANAAHEIKTPLAALQANLEAADIKNNKWIDNVAYEAVKLTALNNQLLVLARSDTLPDKIKLQDAILPQEINRLTTAIQPQIDAKKAKLTLRISGDKNATTRINLDDFCQLTQILLDNAVKYCDHKITITLCDRTLKISNDGTKIKSKDLPHIFDRFYQSDKSKPGVGLGLAIAQALAQRNHWQLSAKSARNTTFVLSF